MIVIHRGLGMVVPLLGIVAALLLNIVTLKIFGDSYYQAHRWPKLSVLFIAGAGCWIIGICMKKRRARTARKEQAHIASLDPKFKPLHSLAFEGPRDHLMYLPVQYWSLVYFAAGIIYFIKSM